jgi:hypothetical protein
MAARCVLLCSGDGPDFGRSEEICSHGSTIA